MAENHSPVDPRFYTIAAWRRQASGIGRWLYYVGAAEWYLDYQRWKIRVRWWHPVVWFVMTIAFIVWACVGAYREVAQGISGLALAMSPTDHRDTSLRRLTRFNK
ncbi:hypothetical protein TPY_2763 [Sulfobacillus acidophilus TPY]|uniref:Uncharacterized protein n=1 Tax=Sulfobacillus acidophilus (strain ATCC 700253 / DSM 10332 / NAL) TaxID=679936 RepID=G8TU25_SULAD|nr:hypothetical protein TPY_2763 [Sulfobacillus acidophilus TPY]AEW04616.1 hypothetical protein Sulac_1116 [Sulfobacillus acidophilus DSM 10332]